MKKLSDTGAWWYRKPLRIMRNTCILLAIFTSHIFASTSYSQSTHFNMSMRNASLASVFSEIEKTSEFSIIYKTNEVNLKEMVSIDVDDQTVDVILSKILENQGLTYTITDKHIVVHKPGTRAAAVVPAPQQTTKRVTGVVSESDGEPMIGVTVLEKGTTNGTVTGINGDFALDVQPNAVLQFSYIGFTAKEVTVGNLSVVNVTLEEDTQQLDDIIVVGYAIGNKRSVSGAVERVRREDMNQGVITEPLDALKGKVAGVVISNSGGDPTGDINIRIRGTTSLSGGNDPLVIIDGVFGDMRMLNALSPSDIEAMTILKDASETAQYGSRGAAGVIVVTTAKGKAGFANVEYNGTYGVNTVYKTLDMLSANDYRAAVNKLGLAANDLGGNTNWFDEISRNTFVHTHNLSISNGNENSNFRASLGVIDRPGIIRNTGSTSYTAKIDGSQYMFDKKVKLDLGMFGSRRESDQLFDIYRTFYSAASYNPTFPNHKNENGVWDEDVVALEVYNPLGMLEVTNKQVASHINTHASINWEIIDGLNLMGFGSYTYFSRNNRQYIPNDIQQGISNGGGMARLDYREQTDLMGNLQLNYTRDFGKHSISALALLEAQKQTYFESWSQVKGFETNYFLYNNMQAGANVSWGDVRSNNREFNLLSYMARANYMYDGKYVFTGNLRRDGSSKLGANNKWGFFPSASVAWVVTGEEFMKSIPQVTNLKIRAGYGVTGNQDAIDPYNSLQLMQPNGTTLLDGSATTTFNITSNSNPDLRWEKKHTFDVGLDLSMFDSRLRLTADYYASRTKDMLYNYTVSVPPFVYTSMLANLGEMSNNGFEIAVSGDIVKTRDFSFSMGVNLAFQKNKVISLSGTYMGEEFTTSEYIQLAHINASGLTQNNGVTYLTEGQPVGVFYIPRFIGFDESADGKKMYQLEDIDGNGTIDTSNSGDRYIAGQAIPKTYLGTNLTFKYKNFDLQTQLNGAFGHHIYNGTSLTFNNMNLFPTYNVMQGAVEKSIYDIQISDYYLEKGDYVNIEYITLGYTIPVKKLNWKYVKDIRLAFSVNNVATITGYSGMTPMINSTNMSQMRMGNSQNDRRTLGIDDKLIYPLNRTYSLSVAVKF